jgi:hypothetical protein
MPLGGVYFKPMWKGIIFIAALAGLGLCLFLYPLRALTLSQNDRIISIRWIKPGDTFQLAFLHSIALSEVRDIFEVDSDYRLVLIETRFQGQGTGLPSNLAPGEELHREGDWFRISGMRRVIPAISWRIQSQWRNRFRFGNDSDQDLSAKIGDALILIRIQKMSAFSFLGASLKSKNFVTL